MTPGPRWVASPRAMILAGALAFAATIAFQGSEPWRRGGASSPTANAPAAIAAGTRTHPMHDGSTTFAAAGTRTGIARSADIGHALMHATPTAPAPGIRIASVAVPEEVLSEADLQVVRDAARKVVGVRTLRAGQWGFAGVAAGDLVTAIDGVAIHRLPPSSIVRLTVQRPARISVIRGDRTLTFGFRPDPIAEIRRVRARAQSGGG